MSLVVQESFRSIVFNDDLTEPLYDHTAFEGMKRHVCVRWIVCVCYDSYDRLIQLEKNNFMSLIKSWRSTSAASSPFPFCPIFFCAAVKLFMTLDLCAIIRHHITILYRWMKNNIFVKWRRWDANLHPAPPCRPMFWEAASTIIYSTDHLIEKENAANRWIHHSSSSQLLSSHNGRHGAVIPIRIDTTRMAALD